MSYLKGKSALMICDMQSKQRSKRNKLFWAREYYVATIGNVTDEIIKEYILAQIEEHRKETQSARL